METEGLYIAIIAVVSALSGVLLGGGSVAVILARANESKELKDSTEQLLFKSVPAELVAQANQVTARMQDLVEQVIPVFRNAAQFVKDVTDGKPNDTGIG